MLETIREHTCDLQAKTSRIRVGGRPPAPQGASDIGSAGADSTLFLPAHHWHRVQLKD